MVVRMRHTRGHTRNRRSHHALKEGALLKCGACGATRAPHRACSACGIYNGRHVLDVTKKKERAERKAKEKAEKTQN